MHLRNQGLWIEIIPPLFSHTTPPSLPSQCLPTQHPCLILPAVPPSPELVKRVRDLYHKRLPDVRFLIPVLNGLEKVGN